MPPIIIASSNLTRHFPVKATFIACLISIALHTGTWSLWQGMATEPLPKEKPPLVVEVALTTAPSSQPVSPQLVAKPTPQQSAPAPAAAKPPPKKLDKPKVKPKMPAKPKPKPVDKPTEPLKAPAPTEQKSLPTPVTETVSTVQSPQPISSHTTAKSNPNSETSAVSEPLVKAAYSAPGLNNPPTRYPRIAQMRQWEGTVVLDIRVLANGSAGEVKIVRGSGHEILDESAVEQVKSWRFIPAHRGNMTVNDWVRVPISFKFKH
ncbi:MAG: energy transducer TonB [Methylovulum sp.]|uniref:energy transducer TonB n=1 Tax=Methylovulum sp. TaxID=1916980 RepID=UPI00260CB306|nr:energy transducer TonB [Methylovulum sp.]MDD2724959.1 energy transducer TonB [Methylovulum sp.]MDD5123517.1 energy transducer TonB [Methylovulum sp.]